MSHQGIGGVRVRKTRFGEATGINAPIDRLTFLRGRTTFEGLCPPKVTVCVVITGISFSPDETKLISGSRFQMKNSAPR